MIVIVVVAGWFFWSRRAQVAGAPPAQGAASSAAAAPAKAAQPPPGSRFGNVSATMTVVQLTPAAQIQAEKFRCICGCRLALGECTCSKSPGSVDMKRTLQDLVNKGLSPADIEKGMVEKYGAGVRL